MKIFLSWSGETSHKVACALRDWLPMVIQSIKPYVSSEDIDKGTRWSSDIAKELEQSTYGILCITRSNLEAPWINFEAGALSKTIDKALVAPFLYDIKRSEVKGPLLQFQSTVNEREDIEKLLTSINGHLEKEEQLEEQALRRTFEVWWPQLEGVLASIQVNSEEQDHRGGGKQSHKEEILEELLELARTQQKLLRSPEELFPPDYVVHILRSQDPSGVMREEMLEVAMFEFERLMSRIADLDIPEEFKAPLLQDAKHISMRIVEAARLRRLIRARPITPPEQRLRKP